MGTADARDGRPLLLIVTGPPASGKTRIARELARRLELPFIVKDTLKERLYEVFGSDDELESAIERASLAILFSVVDSQLAAGVSVVAESNFDARTDTGPFTRLCAEHGLRIVQVHCTKSPDDIERRFAERASSGDRHPGHTDTPERAPEVRADAEAGRWDALEIPGELIAVDVDALEYDDLVERLRSVADHA